MQTTGVLLVGWLSRQLGSTARGRTSVTVMGSLLYFRAVRRRVVGRMPTVADVPACRSFCRPASVVDLASDHEATVSSEARAISAQPEIGYASTVIQHPAGLNVPGWARIDL